MKKEPLNRQFDDCTKKVLLEVDMVGSSDDEDQEINIPGKDEGEIISII